jgi:ABC-2 type transport system permease protein
MTKIWEIVRKEWGEVFKNRFVLFTVALMPLLFTIIPLVMLYYMGTGGDAAELTGAVGGEMDSFMDFCGDLQGIECGQYVLLTQFLILFLMMPVMIPVTIASYSIVGEKTTRTLEPVLATPITTFELLAGKSLAGIIPAVAVTFLSYGVFIVGTSLLAYSSAVTLQLLEPLWLLAVFAIGPLLSLTAVSLAVMISSRVNDPRVAEQLSALVMLPILGLFVAQSFGVLQLNQNVIVWGVLGLALLDAVLLYFAIQLFQRETILTRWK